MAKKPSILRHDVVLIRDSTAGQDEAPQRDNVTHLLAKRGVHVPDKHWRQFVVSRSKVLTGKGFDEVMAEVTDNRVGTIYVESQDRFGGKNSKELFSVLATLQKHGTKLIDLTEDMDLTSDELINEIRTFLASQKSQEELRAIGRRSLRSRVNNFKEHGNWSNGKSPFGYGKALYREDDTVRWWWFPVVSNVLGDRYNPDGKGGMVLSETGIRVPPRDSRQGNARPDKIYLVPHCDKQIVGTVQLAFELYALHGLSMRAISIRLNKEGRTYYGKPFNFSMINEIIKNPVYVGTSVFGKRTTGEYYSFDEEGTILKIKKDATDEERAATEQNITKLGTHDALISDKLWRLAVDRKAKIAKARAEGDLVLPPASANYFLKGLLVCGHCGKLMTSRRDGKNFNYCCSTYNEQGSKGLPKTCGYQTINHTRAEELILAQLKQRNIDFDKLMKGTASEGLRKRLLGLEDADEQNSEQINAVVKEGTTAVVAYFKDNYDLDDAQLRAIKQASQQFLKWGGKLDKVKRDALPVKLAEFRTAFREAESLAITKAIKHLDELKADYKAHTAFMVKATAMQQELLRPQIAEIEAGIAEWQSKCLPVRERLRELGGTFGSIKQEQEELLREWDGMDDRVKGEMLKRILGKVVLFWNKTWHEQEATPSRERKTERPGRYSYHLDETRISWEFKGCEAYGSW